MAPSLTNFHIFINILICIQTTILSVFKYKQNSFFKSIHLINDACDHE